MTHPADRRAHPDIVLIEAGVEMTEPTGAETVVSLRLAGEGALARVAPDMRLPIGANTRFAVATRSICLFDPETEMLIA